MRPEELAARVRQHQAGVLLDTNVLLLYLARKISPGYAEGWKRTPFTARHGDVLDLVVGVAHRLVTTPHVLAEASNLASEEVKRLLQVLVATVEERTLEARLVGKDPEFLRLGLADCGLLTMAGRHRRRPLIVTVDGPLTVELERRNLPVLNLNHIVFPTP